MKKCGIMLGVVLCGCVTRPVTFERHTLRRYENRTLRRRFGHNKEEANGE
jgi:hypothetical protein